MLCCGKVAQGKQAYTAPGMLAQPDHGVCHDCLKGSALTANGSPTSGTLSVGSKTRPLETATLSRHKSAYAYTVNPQQARGPAGGDTAGAPPSGRLFNTGDCCK